jgi:hypothetical protein
MTCGRWSLVGLWVLSAGLHACATAPAANRPAEPPPEDAAEYYPLQSGWKWAYEIDRAGETILAVYAVVQRNGAVAVLQAGDEKLVYAVRPEGIVRGEPARDSPALDFLLKSPLRLGTQWPIDGGTATVAAVAKTVSVPAGQFVNCVVIEENRSAPARLTRTTYAPGTGPITIELLVHDDATGAFEPALRARLRGVTAPGADPLK